jgi:hypothetical protein
MCSPFGQHVPSTLAIAATVISLILNFGELRMLEDDEVMVDVAYWSSCSDHEGEQRHLRYLLGQSWARSLALGGRADNLCKPELLCVDC